jgi:hypothetical protein
LEVSISFSPVSASEAIFDKETRRLIGCGLANPFGVRGGKYTEIEAGEIVK